MNKTRGFFHKISYLQYPLVVVSLYYYTLFAISLAQAKPACEEMNTALVFYGIALSFIHATRYHPYYFEDNFLRIG